ncbi:MAG: RNA-guided endonuclease InsQ/TnpB family protein [Candidatus Methanospirareceae archaeon]
MRRTYRFRIYPSKEQEEKMEQWLNTSRHLYNKALAERKEAYERDKTYISYYDQANALKKAKKSDESLRAVHSQVLQDVLRRLDKAFQNFFRRVKNGEKPGYPRFKSKDRFNSFTFPQSGFDIREGKLILSKIGAIKLTQHREIPKEGVIKTCAIKRDVDQWYVTFVVEVPDVKTEKVRVKSAAGVDLGLNEIATLSTGEKVDNPRWLRKSEKKLAKEQRKLSRKKRGSNNRKKQKLIVAKVHRKIRNQRRDFHHKISKRLVADYDLIVFEDLKVKNMVKNHYLAKSISDAGWNELVSFVSYKAESAGKIVELINPNGTSQICSRCGVEVKKTSAVRMHKCPYCGLVIDRDENAALNILKRGLEKIGQGLSESKNACGDSRWRVVEAGSHLTW